MIEQWCVFLEGLVSRVGFFAGAARNFLWTLMAQAVGMGGRELMLMSQWYRYYPTHWRSLASHFLAPIYISRKDPESDATPVRGITNITGAIQSHERILATSIASAKVKRGMTSQAGFTRGPNLEEQAFRN